MILRPPQLLALLAFAPALALAAPSGSPAAPKPAASALAAPRTLLLTGTATNTTADVTAPMTLTLVIDGEAVTATLRTDPPLSGSGTLTGRLIGGWCELRGKLDEGFEIEFRGALNARDFRGTYVAAVPGQLVQYGKFQLAPPAAATPPKKPR